MSAVTAEPDLGLEQTAQVALAAAPTQATGRLAAGTADTDSPGLATANTEHSTRT